MRMIGSAVRRAYRDCWTLSPATTISVNIPATVEKTIIAVVWARNRRIP